MSAAMSMRLSFDPVRVELWSGTIKGARRYFVDYVEADGGCAGMWEGSDIDEARAAARTCAEDGTFPALDMTGARPIEIYRVSGL